MDKKVLADNDPWRLISQIFKSREAPLDNFHETKKPLELF